jgi:hypothetical protein
MSTTFPTISDILEKYKQDRDRPALYIILALVWDYKFGYLRADLVEHGAIRKLYNATVWYSRHTNLVATQDEAGSASLFQAAYKTDEPILLTLILLWNERFVPVIQHPRGDICHVKYEAVCDFFDQHDAPRCSVYWRTIHEPTERLDRLLIPRPRRVLSHLGAQPSNLHPFNSAPRMSLVLDQGVERPPIWECAIESCTTVLVCQFRGLEHEGRFDVNQLITSIILDLQLTYGYMLLEVVGLRFAFLDDWTCTRECFELHCRCVAARRNGILLWAKRVFDPGTGLFLYGDKTNPHIDDRTPSEPARRPIRKSVVDLMKRELACC